MNKVQIVNNILNRYSKEPTQLEATAYAPSNIALAKYWGKRNEELNLPCTSSLSISLNQYGATTTITQYLQHDTFQLNGELLDVASEFSIRLKQFLDLFRPQQNFYFAVDTHSTVPVAAGVASSACGFAALTLALNTFFAWKLDDSALSILARLGSGSACRSLWHGFAEWQAGMQEDGMDSFAQPLPYQWPELRIGLLLFSTEKKVISSRTAMRQTVNTSPFYKEWPQQVSTTLEKLHTAIQEQNFSLLGEAAESNALAMHSTMLTAQPSICYWQPETVMAMQKVWQLRSQGLSIYFTQDAGPNLKLLYLQQDEKSVREYFSQVISISPFLGLISNER